MPVGIEKSRILPTALSLGALWASLVLFCPACAEQVPERELTPELPPVKSLDSPAWSPAVTDDDPAVATVNGVPLPLSLLREAAAGDNHDRSPGELLERLIELELLAQRALEEGYYQFEVVGPARRAALVTELIAETLTRPPPESFFTDELLRHLYDLPGIRVRFRHKDIFRVIDLQFVCCAMHYTSCPQREFEACMKEEEPHARMLFEYLAEVPDDIDALRALVQEWQVHYPRLALREYSFFYDVNRPYEEQSGFSIVNKNVAKAVLELDENEFAAPVASYNAWHILRLEEHHPEKHRTLDDPEVRREIIEGALPRRLEAEFEALVAGLKHAYNVRVYPDAVEYFFYDSTTETELQ